MPRLKGKKPTAIRSSRARRPARGRMAMRKKTSRRLLLGGFFICCIGVAIILGLHERFLGMVNRVWQQQSVCAGFVIKDIFVEGRQYVSREDILNAIAARPGDCIFKCNPHTAKVRLESIPWIQSALVQRCLPNKLYVRLVERRPIALWQNQSKMYMIDKDGAIIRQPFDRHQANLIVVVGQDAPKHAADLLNELAAFPSLQKEVTAAVWISGRRWDLFLNHKIRVKLPETNIAQALQHLREIQKKKPQFQQDINTIDIRIPDRSFLYIENAPNYGITNKSGSVM